MHSRLYKKIGILGLIALTTGCVQATRHSNTMLFGTNTNVGVKVGQNVNQVPEVVIGYDRQEAVIMPLVANTGDNGKVQKPCPINEPVTTSGGAKYTVHPCSLVAVRGEAMDSYSVLASFGAQIEGNGAGPESQVGLAQYFATGMAAQLLALNGGASVVAVGDAAMAASVNPPDEGAVEALVTGDSSYQRGVSRGKEYKGFAETLVAKIHLTPVGQLPNKITQFETAAKSGVSIQTQCTTIEACKTAVKAGAYAFAYRLTKDDFDTALQNW